MEKYSKQRRKIVRCALYSLFALGLTLVGCNKSKDETPMQTVYAASRIEPENRTLESYYLTAIQGQQDVDVFAQITGKIVKVCVTEGQHVKRGYIALPCR